MTATDTARIVPHVLHAYKRLAAAAAAAVGGGGVTAVHPNHRATPGHSGVLHVMCAPCM
jgi:hypothetical protein